MPAKAKRPRKPRGFHLRRSSGEIAATFEILDDLELAFDTYEFGGFIRVTTARRLRDWLTRYLDYVEAKKEKP